MCVLSTTALAAVAVAATVASTAVSVESQRQAGRAAKFEADANERMALNEAIMEFKSGREEAFVHGIQARRDLGIQENESGAANTDLAYGSSRDILKNRYNLSARDSIAIMTSASRRSIALRNSASVIQARGANQSTGYKLASAGTALGGIGQAVSFAGEAYGGVQGKYRAGVGRSRDTYLPTGALSG